MVIPYTWYYLIHGYTLYMVLPYTWLYLIMYVYIMAQKIALVSESDGTF